MVDVKYQGELEVHQTAHFGLPVAHGAAVAPIGGGARVLDPAVAQGAFVPASALGRAVEVDGGPASGTTGRPWGPDVV